MSPLSEQPFRSSRSTRIQRFLFVLCFTGACVGLVAFMVWRTAISQARAERLCGVIVALVQDSDRQMDALDSPARRLLTPAELERAHRQNAKTIEALGCEPYMATVGDPNLGP